MANDRFKVALTGDAGYDIYTRMEKGYISKDRTTPLPVAAIDIDVPSGAAFSGVVFQQVLQPADFEVVSLVHRQVKDTRRTGAFLFHKRHLIHLRSHHEHDRNGGPLKRSVLRATQTEPIENITTTLNRDAYSTNDQLVDLFASPDKTDDGSDLDLLVIHDGTYEWREYPNDYKEQGVTAIKLAKSALNKYRQSAKNLEPDANHESLPPTVIVNLSHELPKVERNRKGTLVFPSSLKLWNTLAAEPKAVCVVCSADVLRSTGLSISRRLSWEQTVEDLLTEIESFERLRLLCEFKHLIVRFGMVAAVHVTSGPRCRKADLVFAPTAKEMIFRDPLEDGQLFGNNVLLTASIINHLLKHRREKYRSDLRGVFVSGLKTGLQGVMRVYEHGYQMPKQLSASVTGKEADSDPANPKELGEEFVRLLVAPAKSVIENGYIAPSPYEGGQSVLGHFSVPQDVIASCTHKEHAKRRWNILAKSLSPDAGVFHLDPAVLRINLGVAIVTFGHSLVVNRDFGALDSIRKNDHTTVAEQEKQAIDVQICDILSRLPCPGHEIPDNVTVADGQWPKVPTQIESNKLASSSFRSGTEHVQTIYTPVRKFGRLTVIERDEIESLSSIRNLMKGYLENQDRGDPFTRPISIAVFGPPGSGKSFTVKQISEDVNASLRNSRRALETIEYNVAQIQSVDQLADAFVRVASINNEGKTPLVFFDEFDSACDGRTLGWLKYFLAPMNDGTYYGPRQTISIGPAIFVFAGGVYDSFHEFTQGRDKSGAKRFKQKKGPDFVSRLSGHIDILPANSDPGETKHIIRRAITLRGLIESRGLTIARSAGDHRVQLANIDEDIVFAMLTVNRYRHGMRSMEAILRMCHSMDGRIEKASLPSRAQLDMHVDANEFYSQMLRGRSRPKADETSEYSGQRRDVVRRDPEKHENLTEPTKKENPTKGLRARNTTPKGNRKRTTKAAKKLGRAIEKRKQGVRARS